MCGRATGWRGELRLAKLSLAVSDSFLSDEKEERKEEEWDERRVEEGGWTWRALRYPRAAFPRSSPSKILRQEPQISSFSSSCTQPILDLIACPVLFLVSDSSLHLFSSVFLSLYLLSSFFRDPLRLWPSRVEANPENRGST